MEGVIPHAAHSSTVPCPLHRARQPKACAMTAARLPRGPAALAMMRSTPLALTPGASTGCLLLQQKQFPDTVVAQAKV